MCKGCRGTSLLTVGVTGSAPCQRTVKDFIFMSHGAEKSIFFTAFTDVALKAPFILDKKNYFLYRYKFN